MSTSTLTLTLSCGGGRHRLAYAADGSSIDALDHDPADVEAELALRALGGVPVPCAAVLDAWRANDVTRLPMPLRQDALPALLPRLAATGHELSEANRNGLAVVGRNVLWSPLSNLIPGPAPQPALGFDVRVGRAARSALKHSPGQAAVQGFVTPTYSQITVRLTLSWFTDIWLVGLAEADGEFVAEARRHHRQAHVRIAKFFDQPAVLDSFGDPLQAEPGQVWRLATVPMLAEQDDAGAWHLIARLDR